MWNKDKFIMWAKDTAVRTVKTMAETAGGFVVVGLAINEIDWLHMLSVTAVAGVATVILALAKLPEVKDE